MSNRDPNLFGLSSGAKQQLLQRMGEGRRRRRDRETPDPSDQSPLPQSKQATPKSLNCRFEELPGYRELALQRAAAEHFGIANPYFRMYEGVGRNTISTDGRECINFASYNYLDLCGQEAISKAAKQAIDQYGTSVSASRAVSGERPVQRELERALARMHGVEDCVVFVSGHGTNVSSIGQLVEPGDLILHDALIHNSIIVGAKLSGAKRMSFPHNNWSALDTLLEKHRNTHERAIVVIEGLYSMDGDFPDLPRFIDVKRRHQAFLMIDEAHSIGVLGKHGFGIGEHFGVGGGDVDIWMGTLSKTLASCGGYIAGDHSLIDYLKFSASGFFYSVGMSPALAAAALAALGLMREEPDRVARLLANSTRFLRRAKEAGLNTGTGAGYAVVPVWIGSSIKTVKLANALFDLGVTSQPIIHPAVEEGAGRLRFFVSSAHTDSQIDRAVQTIAEELVKLG